MINEFINSPIFIAILGVFFTVIGWGFTTLFGKFKSVDDDFGKVSDKIKELELSQAKHEQSSIELINIRTSLKGFGARIGDTESEVAVMQSNNNNVMEALKEIKTSEKETSQAFISTLTQLQKAIQNMSVDIACIKQKIGV